MKRLVVSALSICSMALVVGAFPGPASAEGDTGNNFVVLQNTVDHNSVARAGVGVARDEGDVKNQNLGYAESKNCSGCRTVAVAMQVIIEEGNPQTVAPENAAVAVNTNCTVCTTFAFAYQYLLTPHRDVHLSEQTREQVDRIEEQARQTASSNLSNPDMSARLDSLFAQLVQTVNQDMQNQGEHGGGEEHKSEEQRQG